MGALLLNISERAVRTRLNSLHSVLSIPTSKTSPVRMFHLLSAEFILDDAKKDDGRYWFWVDKQVTHGNIDRKCLDLMSREGSLKMDVCNLKEPGKPRSEVGRQVVDENLDADI
jgi:hypothetical protein